MTEVRDAFDLLIDAMLTTEWKRSVEQAYLRAGWRQCLDCGRWVSPENITVHPCFQLGD